MRLQPLSKRDFGAENDPYFNLEAAVDTFNWYMTADRDEANLLLGMSISKSISQTVSDYHEELQAALDQQFNERLALLERTAVDGAITKSMSDGAVNAVAENVEVFKSFQSYTTYERSRNANLQRRGAGGRFATMGRTDPTYKKGTKRSKNPVGAADQITDKRAAGQYEEAYKEVLRDLGRYGASADRPLRGMKTVSDATGNKHTVPVQGHIPEDIISPSDFDGPDTDKGNVRSIEWLEESELNVGGSGIYADPIASDLSRFNTGAVQAGTVYPGESGTTRGFRQIGNATNVINNSGLTDNAGPKTRAALAAGKYVGDYGPEAEKVLGPHIRRSAYRYRGVERKPDKEMIGAMAASTRGSTNPDEARRDLIVPKNIKVETGYGLETRLQPSPFLQYWQNRLPDPDLVNLHVNAGAIAPSEGVIINRSGEVVTQASGYGDDHYLPFNLTKLGRAKGGEYVRTRTVGGPTTEDVYAGLMSGARSMTVVSHSGIYTVEFDEAFRGGRRYNDKAARMTQRYGMLTDALASKSVQLQQIPPARRKELRDQAAEEIPGNTPAIARERESRYRELQELERKNPLPSQAVKDDWTQEWLLEHTEQISAQKTISGNKALPYLPSDRTDMTPERLRSTMELQAGKRFANDEEFIAALGEDEKYRKFMEFKSEEYRQSMKPLNLNGAGYHKALLALKEQFPYYISTVTYIPNQDVEGQKRRDKGYVKARHLRSDDILTGYFDQEIEGAESGRDKNGKQLAGGKRRASQENYANYYGQQRATKLVRRDDDGGGGLSFSEGGSLVGGVATPSDTDSVPGMASAKEALTHAGIKIERRPGGLAYTGWGVSPTIDRGSKLGDWEQVNGLIKVREGLREIDEITYYDNNTRKKASIWVDDPSNTVTQRLPVLTMNIGDDEWATRLQNNPGAIDEARKELEILANDQGRRSIEGGIYRTLESKGNLVTNATGNTAKPEHPTSVRGVVQGLKSGDERKYDFTIANRSGYRGDGSNYLPDLTQREYFATWNSDPDIQGFMATSERRFGYRMSMTQDPHKFHGLSKDFGKAMDEGLDQADEWRRQIRKYGSPRDIPTHTVVKYGGNSYSAYSVSDLENAIARDALAVAKMKQLYAVNVGAMPDPDKPDTPRERSIDIDSEYETKSEGALSSYEIDRAGDLPRKQAPDLRFPKHEYNRTEFSEKEKKPSVKRSAINEKKLLEARRDIDAMVGMNSAKREYNSLVQDAQIAQLRQAEGLPVENKTMHLVFTGQPGTGKTTFANSLAKTYNALGILPTDKVAMVTRSDLTGQYLGETAQKTRKVFDDNKGGVIFIDEAYSLANGPNDQYGKEAIDEIVALSEDRRNNTVVILAGYPGDMNSLFETNPGLKSRFPRTIKFPNYSANELNDIASRQAAQQEYVMEPGASKEIARVTRRIHMAPNMSNARDTRNFIDDVSRTHTSRISKIPEDEITREILTTVTADDVRAAEKMYFSERTASNGTKKLVPA